MTIAIAIEIEENDSRAQIRLNTRMMSTIEELRATNDQLTKERNFFKVKWTFANEQIIYLKKKINKDVHDENVNPNVNAAKSNVNADNINETAVENLGAIEDDQNH